MIRALVTLGTAAALAVAGKATYTLRDAPVEGGLCDATVKSTSGYVDVANDGPSKSYFYWFFESRSSPSTDPLIVWLTGGPGCSSQLALLSENGPCTPTADGQGTVNNPYSWNTKANIMWVDQPAGVGYSYGFQNDHNETMVGEDMYHFLQGFFDKYPQYLENEFYVFGESYGGHFVPATAHRIFRGNAQGEGKHIKLSGIGIGNGLTDPFIQYQYYPAMAMNNSYGIKTVSEDAYEKMVEHLPFCLKLARACQLNVSYCEQADTYCNLVETTPYYRTGLNPYDIRRPCGESDLCYDFTNVETFLNLPSTRAALHVSDEVKEWKTCNTVVNVLFVSDWMRDFQQYLVPLLENGVRALIYAGDVDFICNWIGNKAWTMDLNWTGKKEFNAATDSEWKYGSSSKVGGMARTAKSRVSEGQLTFLQVYEAGHMVPMDQPEAALDMLTTFTQKKSFY